MMRRMLLVSMLAAAFCMSVYAAEEKVSESDKVAITQKVANSLVRVEYTLRFDKGEAPGAGGWAERCPNCGQYHSIGDGEQLVKDERPLEAAGLLLSERSVLTSDVVIHPRFIEKIEVRYGSAAVGAKIERYCKDENAVILELSSPLEGARPIQFDAAKEEPYFLVSYTQADGTWTTAVKGLGGVLSATEDGRSFLAVEGEGLIVARDGTAVGVCTTGELALEGKWKKSPLEWAGFSAAEMSELLSKLDQKAAAAILRVTLNFRSPKANNDRERYMMNEDESESVTEMNTAGLLVGTDRVLILANMQPNVTARLERITVHTQDGNDLNAVFEGTLKDYGAFAAKLDKPLEGAAAFSDKDILGCRSILLPAVEVAVQGKKRVSYTAHRRIPAFETGWRRQKYPQMPMEEDKMLFLFDEQLRLLAAPVARRQKVSEREGYYYGREDKLTAAKYLSGVLTGLAANIDAGNVPLSEEQENRLAWMGVELQEMNRELARINKVSDLTSDGQTGALVSYVYPGSPAANAGIEAGAILLRLHVAGEPKPLDIDLQNDSSLYMEGFPWDRLDEVPDEYLDQIPQPWPSAENSFTRALTDIGFGTKYTAEFFINGQQVQEDFEVVESPAHYDSAARFKSEQLGVTVRNLTYEVRRFFQKPEEDPGVIVSKVEPGSKAAVSGIKPYEIITHVNDQPVMTVKDFETMAAGLELRLSVKRMTKGRVVKIAMPAAAAGEQESPEQ